MFSAASVALKRHQVEDPAHLVQAAGDHVHFAGHVAGVVASELQADAFPHRLLRDPLLLVGRGDGVELGERTTVQLGLSREAIRRHVGHQVVVAADADVRGA